MKLVMDEKLKHRLVGISVILSLGAIFLPAMMKKSNQRLENNFSVKIQFPPKPTEPNVAVTDEAQMYKTIKIVKPGIRTISQANPVSAQGKDDITALAPIKADVIASATKLEPVSKPIKKTLEIALNNAAKTERKKEVRAAITIPARSVKAVVKAAKIQATSVRVAKVNAAPKRATSQVNRVAAVSKDIYAVQLASFVELNYAQALVQKLHNKGYTANYIRVAGRKGVFYKVYAGHSPLKHEVVQLKMQLASTMQLHGFIVNTGVS